MQVGIMITDGNNVHPADYHAEVTANKIIIVAETASEETKTASRELRRKVETILTEHHQRVHDHEQSALAEEGIDRCQPQIARRARDADPSNADHVDAPDTTLDASQHVDDEIVQEIADAAKGTILEAHFARADVQEVIREILHHETRSQMNVHREVHVEADRLARAASK